MRKINMRWQPVLLSVALLGLAACTGDFEDINRNPNQVTEEQMDALNYKTGTKFKSLQSLVIPVQEHMYQFNESLSGGPFGGYIGATVDTWQTKFETYNPSADWRKWPFANVITETYTPYKGIVNGTEDEVAIAFARLLRVAIMHRVTDSYGPIPYSKMQNGTFSVPYDSQRDVYMAMIDDLDAAMETLYTFASAGDGILMRDFDISSFKGDSRLWVSFANTLKLRMAIRMSGVEPEARRIAEEAVRDMATYGLIDANAENLSFSSDSRQNPFYTQATSTSWQDLRSNASIVMYMNAYEDPRRASYFSKSGYDGIYVGVRAGIQNVTPTDYATYSYPLFAEKDPVPVMYASESWFLRAEGALLGWTMGDTAENLYNTGVKTSLELWGNGSSYETYIASETAPALSYADPRNKHNVSDFGTAVSVKWADDGNELERIITQKWIANHMIGHEAWADVRRTGYPRLLQVVNNLSGGMWGNVDSSKGMRRLHYPQSEYDNNRENVLRGVELLGGSDLHGTDVWWAKK